MLFVPTSTKTDLSLPESMMFSTLSVIASMLAPGKQTTTSFPLFKTLSFFLTTKSPTNTLALFLTPLYHCRRIALPLDPFRHILSCSLVTWQTIINLPLTHQPVTSPSHLLDILGLPSLLIPSFLLPSLPSPSLPLLSLSSPSLPLSFLPVSFLPHTSCLLTTCHLTSSQPPPRLR